MKTLKELMESGRQQQQNRPQEKHLQRKTANSIKITLAEVIARHPDYQIFDLELFENLERYMQNAEGEYDINKGLLFIGGVGSGKTKLMEILKEYAFWNRLDKHFRIENIKKIQYIFQNKGYDTVEYFTDGMNLCIDDIGQEASTVKNYGNEINIFEDLITNFYSNGFKNGYLYHGTSNISIKGISELYGERVYDRMREMFNVIVVNNPSFRKLK